MLDRMSENSFVSPETGPFDTVPSDTRSLSKEISVSGFSLNIVRDPESDGCDAPPAQLPVPADLVTAFAEATGWVIGFEETAVSFRDRTANRSTKPTGGMLRIVDMSPHWPAQTPTAHRAKCDRFVESLDRMIQPLLKSQAAVESEVARSV